MTRIGKSFAVLLLLGLTGCRVGWLIDRIAPDAVRDSKNYFEELRQRHADKILDSFDPSADKDHLRSELGKVIALVPQQEPIGIETLGATGECKGSGICTKLVTLEYKYPDRLILFQITVSNRSGHYAITNIYVEPETNPLESRNRFTLRGKGWLHYFILMAALLSVSLAVFSVVLCIRTPIPKRKWLWIVASILGIGKLGIEWSNGLLWYKVLYISILPIGWGFDTESPFVYVSFPFGAILILQLRRRLLRSQDSALSINTPTNSNGNTQNDSGL